MTIFAMFIIQFLCPNYQKIVPCKVAPALTGLSDEPSLYGTSFFYIMEETWKSVSGYNGAYQVSSLGRVKSVAREIDRKLSKISQPEIILKDCLTKFGYPMVALWKNGVIKSHTIHKLVAMEFITTSMKGMDVNHKNGIKTDNRVENLEVITRSENLKHRYRVLRQTPPMTGIFNKGNSRIIKQFDKAGQFIAEFKSCSDAARVMNIDISCARNIYAVAAGKQKTAYGYKWIFA